MPSWTEIQSFVRENYTLAKDEESWFSLVFGYDNGRSHLIRVQRFEAFDEEWVEFRAVVCKGSEMAPQVALRKNANFAIGSLALDGDDDYVLLHNAPLSTLDMPEFQRPLHLIARTADRLEAEYSAENDRW